MAAWEDDDEEGGVYESAQREFGKKYEKLSLNEMAVEMKKAAKALADLGKRKTRAQAAFDLLRYTLIPKKMEDEDITTTTIKGVGRLGTTDDAFVSVKGGMKDKLYAWLRKNKLGALITPTVSSSTLRACMKGRHKDGKKIPTQLINFTPVVRASITKV